MKKKEKIEDFLIKNTELGSIRICKEHIETAKSEAKKLNVTMREYIEASIRMAYGKKWDQGKLS